MLPLAVNQTESQEPALTAEELGKHFMSLADKGAGEFNQKTVLILSGNTRLPMPLACLPSYNILTDSAIDEDHSTRKGNW